MKKQILKKSGLSVAFLLLASLASSHAASITVGNFSFEDNTSVGGFPPPTIWNLGTGNTYTEDTASISLTEGTGARHGGLDDLGSFSQDLGVTFLPSTVYTLTVAVGNRQANVFNGSSGFSNFGLTADNGTTPLGPFTQEAGIVNAFTDYTYTFTTGLVAPTGNVGILLTNSNGPTGRRALFDNVRLDATAVPEPSAALLGGLGLLGLLVRRRR